MRQLTGYRAFIPAPLPPDPPLEMSGTMQRLLSEEDRAALGEGRPGDVAEVVNYVAAMNYGLARLAELPISIRLFREIHAPLLRGARGSKLTPGELRTTQNWIGPGGCTLAEATFVPPPPAEILNAPGALESFRHAEDELPLLIKIGMAHCQFETIHPFLDGNGPMGRLLLTFLLRERAVLPKPVLYLSHFFKRHRQEYYDSGAVGNVQGLLGTTFAGANQIVQRLVDLGILTEITGRARNRRFRYDAYVRLFEDGTES